MIEQAKVSSEIWKNVNFQGYKEIICLIDKKSILSKVQREMEEGRWGGQSNTRNKIKGLE